MIAPLTPPISNVPTSVSSIRVERPRPNTAFGQRSLLKMLLSMIVAMRESSESGVTVFGVAADAAGALFFEPLCLTENTSAPPSPPVR